MKSSNNASLFQEYCYDTNVIREFWDEPNKLRSYPLDGFRPQWNFFDEQVITGRIIAPDVVKSELLAIASKELKSWLNKCKNSFIDTSDPSIINALSSIVNAYPNYTKARAKLNDAYVIATALAYRIKVISQEKPTVPHKNHGKLIANPKIPNVCMDFKIDCYRFANFLINEGFGKKEK